MFLKAHFTDGTKYLGQGHAARKVVQTSTEATLLPCHSQIIPRNKNRKHPRGPSPGPPPPARGPPLLKAPQPVSKSPWLQDGPLTCHALLEQVGPVFRRPDVGRMRTTPLGGSTLICGRKKYLISFWFGFVFFKVICVTCLCRKTAWKKTPTVLISAGRNYY